MNLRFFDGFKFGILLQVAIGPVCFLIFQMSISKGLYYGILGTLGVTLIDGLYILLAVAGIGKILGENKKLEKALKHIGSIILLIFGFYILLSSGQDATSLKTNSSFIEQNPFITASLLTLSNPLTIIFWTGVFASKISNDKMDKKDLALFALGSIFATLTFLSLVSLVGCFTKTFVSNLYIVILNIIIGLFLIILAFKPYLKIKNPIR